MSANRAGRAIRDAERDRQNAKRKCEWCLHPVVGHLELGYGAPGYKPLEFHCTHAGCECVRGPGPGGS